MKEKEENKMKISLKKKILLTILVVVILGIIATVMYFKELYETSEKGKTNKFYEEIKDKLPLDEKRVVISMKKYDLNADGAEDYVGITGIKKYHDEEKNLFKDSDSNIELYKDVEVVYIDGNTKEPKKYATEMSFYKEVKFEIKEDEKNKYIFASDENSGNVILLVLKDNELKNIVKDSIQADFNGYTINVTFDEENTSKIKVKLDNYARSYLNEVADVTELEFEDKAINKDNYRATYLANKFCSFKLEDIDGDNRLELVGVQNILYLNDNKKQMNKNEGTVETIFKINDEQKLEYNKVEIKK